ncbi:hypothetical protein [Parablautia intestinalis]|uniref:hypothetical protein n=1 Tax=Parablautia intestinalis TaxID=2320100 RepID=UPI00256F2314|nr:hypothetical protein [Parablautia intestinalis]
MSVLAVCIQINGCCKTNELVLLRDILGEETPYILQEKLEEQLKLRLDEYIYFDGGIAYESPLLSYKGQDLDYAVLHNRKWDKTKGTEYAAYILLQPADENMTTTMVQLSVYNESMYALAFHGGLNRKIDLGDLEDVQNGLADLLGTSVEFEEVKFWYQGSVKTGNGEAPEYPYFNGKEERVIEIMDWAKKFLKLAELKEDAEIVIRDFPGKLRKLSIERMRNLTCVIL